MARPFRFIAPMPRFDTPATWRDEIRRIEDIGFSTVAVAEHISGWQMEPVVALTAAAEATSSLRLLSLVMCNDFRHPVLMHKSMAMLDVLSSGRVEIGLGAGWLDDDFRRIGVPMDSPAERIDRLGESVRLLKELFAEGAADFHGKHYTVTELEGLPKPIQRPHPPLLIGGGGPRVLRLAARHADIVAIHPRMAAGALGPDVAADLSAEQVEKKIRLVEKEICAVGRAIDDVEIQFNVYLTDLDGHPSSRSSFNAHLRADPDLYAHSPAVLSGSVDRCCDLLVERRERFGISYIQLKSDIESAAPIVARLAGT
ncbi:TIGR03621 family F420-dependent LLM class oxidoreductase [Candidatus Mycobacterium wuenschmannii]|uniref:TIGR03621 family F420-dependent LLM class oxidoreductase n=1 Tax=Candidatus Mycobacterium wuenschmannii TaxID=3027808 RepID=A0ABY8VQ16_9MYCO|nr:TIGR03621 family F420-dependent LLM class oxidoreductase [Candidatus Mycobacterium wuenschmannii]WIM85729.1 TIGR03621 family F420-dependent LLM class oxidoreductase [Candidatus Mycobacterium wuenschmannii]